METNNDKNSLCGGCGYGVCAHHIGVKKAMVWALVFLTIFLAAKSINEFKKYPTIGKDLPVMNTISVTGTGEVVAVPDIATFSFAVTEESLSIVDSQNKVTKTVDGILEYLAKNGIEKNDIKTTGYNIYPRYEYYNTSSHYPNGKQTLAGYDVSQSIEVKVRKIADAGKIIGGIGELGATNVSGLTFGFDKDDELKAEARKDAVTKAKAEAKQIADDLGVSLGRIVSYSESGNYPIYYGMGGDMMSAKAAPSPNIPSGENKITSTVNITYEIR